MLFGTGLFALNLAILNLRRHYSRIDNEARNDQTALNGRDIDLPDLGYLEACGGLCRIPL